MLKLMIDSNVFDVLLGREDLLAAIVAFHQCGELALLVTHLQIGELQEIPEQNRAKREALLQIMATIPATRVPDAALTIGTWRVGESAIASKEDSALLRQMTGGNVRHLEDALIALTAKKHGAALVSEDKRFRKLAVQAEIECYDIQALASLLLNEKRS